MPAPTPKNTKLVWMDLEMTGLEPDRDTIIEIATLITDGDLNLLAEGPELVIHQDPALFATMDDWNREHHKKSGLWQKVVDSKISLVDAEQQTLAFLKQHIGPKESPLCGNSIWQDRRFLFRHMQSLEAYLHYRLVDVSTLKELAARWYPSLKFVKTKSSHRALDDVRESLAELKFYRDHLFKGGAPVSG